MSSIIPQTSWYSNQTDGNIALQPVSLPYDPNQFSKVDRALRESEQGLQTIPLIHYDKRPLFSWKQLQYASAFLHWAKDENTRHACAIAFHGDCNIGFITGAVSNNVFVIDIDRWDDAEVFKHRFIKEFGKTRLTRTSKGLHILVRCPDAIIANTDILDNDSNKIGDLLGNRRIAVLPTSVKKLANGTTFIYHDDTDSASDILDISFNKLKSFFAHIAPNTIVKRHTDRKTRETISQRTQNFIDSGASNGSRNTELFSATSELLNHHTVDHVRQLMIGLADKWIPDEPNQNRLTIESAITSYIDRPQYRNSNARRIGDIAQLALPALEFKGRAGATQKAVYLALAERANLEHGKTSFIATYRQIKLLTGIRKNQSIKNALDNLCERGVLKAMRRGFKGPSQWQWVASELKYLSESRSQSTHKANALDNAGYSVYQLSDFDTINGTYFEQCLREPSALGNTGTDIYLYILNQYEGCRVSEVANALQLNPRTVRRHIESLTLWQLINRDGYTIKARYNATHIESVLVKTGASQSRQKYVDQIAEERLWDAIDHVCKSRISKDKSHLMNKAQYIRKKVDGNVVLQVLKQADSSQVMQSTVPPLQDNLDYDSMLLELAELWGAEVERLFIE